MPPAPLSTVGDYQLVRLIGRGGMGAVYEALHHKIGRRAAIKTLLPDYANDKDMISRFFNEARAVNTINHPGIVQISDLGEMSDGGAYLVMEYLEGETLSVRARKLGKKMPQAAVIRIGWQIASTLSAAHSKGIVHRDIKPANIMIVPDPAGPGRERVKVLDFGIAKLASSAVRTLTGQIMGTMIYMSPEQISTPTKVDGQSDVYSLGAMLFHLLAGRPPFVSSGNEIALMSMHLAVEPPALRSLAPEVSSELEAIIAKMLNKEPPKRPTMAQIAEQLELLDVQASARSIPPHTFSLVSPAEEVTKPPRSQAAEPELPILRMTDGSSSQTRPFGRQGRLRVESLSLSQSEAHGLVPLPFDLSGLAPQVSEPLSLFASNSLLELRVARAAGNAVRLYAELTSSSGRNSYAPPPEIANTRLFVGHHRGPYHEVFLISQSRSDSRTQRFRAQIPSLGLIVEAPEAAHRLLVLYRVAHQDTEAHLLCVAVKAN